MADNSYKINKSLSLNPQVSAPTNPAQGDVYFDSSISSFVYYTGSAWANLDSFGSVASAASMTSALFTPAIVQNSVIRMTGTGGTLHGMTASFNAKRVTLYNNSSGSVVVSHASATEATANNRILTPSAGNMTLIAGEIAQFLYDSTQQRWLLVSVGSGAGAFAPATTTTNGIVILSTTPVSSSAPEVPVVDASDNVVANGVTRSTAGTVSIGTGANDSAVTISKSGATTTIGGALTVTSGANLNSQKITSLGAPTVGTDATTKTYVDGKPRVTVLTWTMSNPASDGWLAPGYTTPSATQFKTPWPGPAAKMTRLSVRVSGTTDAANTITFTVYKNGVATTLAVVLSGASGSATDTVTIATNDDISIFADDAADGSAPTGVIVALEITLD